MRAIRQRFPAARIAYVVEPAAAPVVAGNPNLDEIIVAPRARGWRQLAGDLALGLRLRRDRYDLAIDFHGGPRSSLLTWLSGAPVRIGYEIAGRGWMYTTRVSRPRELRPRHSVENQADLLEPLGIVPPDRATHPAEMAVDGQARVTALDRLARAGVGDREPVIVMHVSAGNPFRRWPIPSFAALAAALVEGDRRRRIVVTSGPSEHEAAATVIAEARRRLGADLADRIVSCGDFSLGELRALADRAALYIGGDSGPLHVASTAAVPIVGLYGPTLPVRSAPWRASSAIHEAVDVAGLPCRPCDQRVCAPGDFRCLTGIAPEQVAAAAERALARAAADKMSTGS